MNVLFVGSGHGGSWQIRGLQIGKALGARVTSRPMDADWHWADLVVLVKHAAEQYGADARASGARIVWDVLDWWKQPEQNQCDIQDVINDIHAIQREFRIDALIGATQAMADELGGICIPHHSRPGLRPLKVRDRIGLVAYEGTPKYLGSWRRAIETICFERNIRFAVNPPDLAEADVIVAFRGEQWDGPICRRWKSGVKYANAIALGRPVLTQRSEAFFEVGTCGALVDAPSALAGMLDLFASRQARQAAYEKAMERAPEFSLETAVQRYRHLFAQVLERAA